MLNRNLLPAWIGVVLLSAMFLAGQTTWERRVPCESVQDCDDLNPCTDEECVDSVCDYVNNTDPYYNLSPDIVRVIRGNEID